MEKEIAERIIEKLGKKLDAKGRFVRLGKGCTNHEIAKESFVCINPSGKSCRIAFIDGGNNTVISSASFCLEAARVYWAVYESGKKKESSVSDFFILASSSDMGKSYEIDSFGTEDSFSGFSTFDSSISFGSHMATPESAVCACRKIAELRAALKLVENLGSGDILVLDRDLEASVTGESKELENLTSIAEKKGIIICGISKTTRLFTDTGDSASAAVSAIAPEGAWILHVGDCDSESHNASVYFAKLHKKSNYIFRLEMLRSQNSLACTTASALASCSSDPVFIGYPYGLVEADRLARVSNRETEYMKLRLIAKSGKGSKRIFEHMKSIDAHSVLDNIS